MTKQAAPKHLSADSRRLWLAIVTEFEIEDPAGTRILQTALEALDRAAMARKQIDDEGMTIRDKFGQLKSHPLLPTERDARSAFLQGMKALNLDLLPSRDGPGRPPGNGRL